MSESGNSVVMELVKILSEDCRPAVGGGNGAGEVLQCRVKAAAGTHHQGPGGCGSM